MDEHTEHGQPAQECGDQATTECSTVGVLHTEQTRESPVEAVLGSASITCENSNVVQMDEPAEATGPQLDGSDAKTLLGEADQSSLSKERDKAAESDDNFTQNERFERTSTEMTTEIPLSEIDPPPSRWERFRDLLFRCLDISILRIVGFAVIFFVIVDGAFFFFLAIGAHGMCTPRTDCEPRNWWLNWSIQVLNGLFTYTAIISFTPRVSNAFHLITPKRSSEVGLDHYGRPTKEIWFHIPPKRRGGIVAFLLGNCLSQFANQLTRIRFYNYDLSNTMPGSLWVNLFFALAMILAAVGAVWQVFEQHKLHMAKPDEIPPGPVAIMLGQKNKYFRRKRKSDDGDSEVDAESAKMGEKMKPIQDLAEPMRQKITSPWKKLSQWFKSIRPSMRLWGF